MNTLNLLTMRPFCRLLVGRRNLGFNCFSSKWYSSFPKKSSSFVQNRRFYSCPSGILGFQCVLDRPHKPLVFSPNFSWGVCAYKYDHGFIGGFENLVSRGSLNARSKSSRTEAWLNDQKKSERSYEQEGVDVKPLVEKIGSDDNVGSNDEECRKRADEEALKNGELGVSSKGSEGDSGGSGVLGVEEEAWKLLKNAVVTYCGCPVGTLAANDPGDKQILNYDQVFLRDFVPSALAFLLKGEGEIVRNFLLDTLQLQVIQILYV